MFTEKIKNRRGLSRKASLVLTALRNTPNAYEGMVTEDAFFKVCQGTEGIPRENFFKFLDSGFQELEAKGLARWFPEMNPPYGSIYLTDEGLLRFDDGKGFCITLEDIRRADKVIHRNTAYDSVEELIANNPTLRPEGFADAIWLRRKYLELTGRPAFC